MTPTLHSPVSEAPATEPIAAPTPQDQHAHAEAKRLKKERKAERLRFFFGWCEGCRCLGNGF